MRSPIASTEKKLLRVTESVNRTLLLPRMTEDIVSKRFVICSNIDCCIGHGLMRPDYRAELEIDTTRTSSSGDPGGIIPGGWGIEGGGFPTPTCGLSPAGSIIMVY